MRAALQAVADGLINTANFCVFVLALIFVGGAYGVVWLTFKATRWAAFHALALVLWVLLTKRIAALSLLVDDQEAP